MFDSYRHPLLNTYDMTPLAIIFLILSASERGFVHNVSPIKKAKTTKRDWYEFQLQLSPTKSYLHPAQNSDVSFTYIEQQKPTQNTTDKPPSVDVTVSEIPSSKSNQRVNISATITIGKKDAKKVLLKSTQQDSFVKEDCVIEDSTGTIMAHIWAPLIDEVKDGQAYLFKNMTIKNFQGSTFVSTSPQTSIPAVTQF
ncbi:hypothetical protein AC249_AIPGENE7178 [Exaiptasia diaphana]|nr:hypothetical protein AC249_AIPGENE7178 [Exaiptasia diaphana]